MKKDEEIKWKYIYNIVDSIAGALIWIALFAALAYCGTSHAASMICTGKSVALNKEVSIVVMDDDDVKMAYVHYDGKVTKIAIMSTYDGHMTGLITGSGFALKYESVYGCYRNAVIITDVRGGDVGYIDTINVAFCAGGTTSDDMCTRK